MRQLSTDRVGLGWRASLAAQVFAHLDDVDVIEVMAEDHWNAGASALRALRSLAAHRPLLVHGVTLGLASTTDLDGRRLDRMARLVNALEPAGWSEHLAFVRGGGYEIGHLAAPPRNDGTLDSTVQHLRQVRAVVGSAPAMENVATLMQPPDSDLSEPAWIHAILRESGTAGLLDLHNLYANALNFGIDPMHYLAQFPLERVRTVHLSGGRIVEIQDPRSGRRLQRLLDDHLHDVPPVVFDMLQYLAAHCLQPLDVILERDGKFPRFEELVRQLQTARAALAAGRRAAQWRQSA